MTATSAEIKKLLERKEAKLTAIAALDKDIEDTKKRLVKQVEDQRKAFKGLLDDGFTSDELKTAGITRRRRPYNTATPAKTPQGTARTRKDPTTAPATETPPPKHTENSTQKPVAAIYDENRNYNDPEGY